MKKILLNVRAFKESPGKSYCGPASLKILLFYHGVIKSEKELAKLCKTDKVLGTSNQNLKKAAEKLGFKTKTKTNGSFKNIEIWLKKGVPVIVNWFTSGAPGSEIPDGHYSVVAGLDEKFIYLQDPEIGRMRKLTREGFMTAWFDFKGKHIKSSELVIRWLLAIYK